MKTPRLITAVTLVELILALLLAGTAVYVLAMTRSPEILAEPDAADVVHGLRIGALALGVPALLLLIGVFGLWKRKMRGWWLTFIVSAGIEAALIYNVFEDGWREAEHGDVITALCFLIFPVLLLLPGVRQNCRTPR